MIQPVDKDCVVWVPVVFLRLPAGFDWPLHLWPYARTTKSEAWDMLVEDNDTVFTFKPGTTRTQRIAFLRRRGYRLVKAKIVLEELAPLPSES